MKNLPTLFAIATLATLATLFVTAGVAEARDLGPDEALKLRDAGTIQSFEKLNAAALAKHPGATIHETELEEEYGRHVYQVEMRDAQGVQWDLELDATNGQILKDHQDD
ncbi:PepSY domain-containing protein [Pseudomonas sp. LFM046]|uniref:PepSY domain-containing protein n=1 Tax=Pseudomonas sp. LFM046 TaxID=1608357 RepID=UPI0005CFC130|nr:PepSY domain-containing protein [Pseudomonas sp. LFM046]